MHKTLLECIANKGFGGNYSILPCSNFGVVDRKVTGNLITHLFQTLAFMKRKRSKPKIL